MHPTKGGGGRERPDEADSALENDVDERRDHFNAHLRALRLHRRDALLITFPFPIDLFILPNRWASLLTFRAIEDRSTLYFQPLF